MARQYNPEISRNAQRVFNFKGGDGLTDEVSPIIQPVVDLGMNVQSVVRGTVTGTATGGINVIQLPSDRDFYLTYGNISFDSNATCDNTFLYMNIRVNGQDVPILIIRKLTTTAKSESISANFGERGIKIDRGTAITVYTTFTVGACNYGGAIAGYFADTIGN